MTKRELKERVRLLEYENEILQYKIKEILKQLKVIKPLPPFPRVETNGRQVGYCALSKRYKAPGPSWLSEDTDDEDSTPYIERDYD